MRYFVKVVVAVLAYFVGLGAYVGVLRAVWHEKITGGEAEAVIFWGGLAYLLVAIPLYLLAFWMIKLARPFVFGFRRLLLLFIFPATAVLVTILPTGFALCAGFFGVSLLALPNAMFECVFAYPEAIPFYAFFGASGLCFSLGWFFLSRA
ncbi:MAG: hypothetical protein V3R58_06100 [candidate division NC10 bacterium]